jgi:capsular polysaccharide biosynthesis protein
MADAPRTWYGQGNHARAVQQELRAALQLQPALESERVYILISRRGQIMRDLWDEQQLLTTLESMFSKRKWVVFSPPEGHETPPLATAASLFSRAELVVGVHGGGLTNILFSFPYAQVIELLVGAPPACGCYARLSRQLGLAYYGYFVPNSLFTDQAVVLDLKDLTTALKPIAEQHV